MAPTFLSSMQSQTPRQQTRNQDDSSRDRRDEKVHAMHTRARMHGTYVGAIQVIRLQRIERQGRESLRNSGIRTAKDTVGLGAAASNNSSSNDGRNDNERGVPLEQQTQDFDVDGIFRLSPSTCPNMRGDPEPADPCHSTLPSATSTTHQLKIFTGLWNMAAKDPFADKKDQYIGDVEAATSPSEFLPLGYDLHVVGTQEKLHPPSKVQAKSAPLVSSPIQTSVCSRTNNNSEPNDSFVESMLQTSSFGLGSSSTRVGSSTEAGSSSSSIFSAAAPDLVRASSSPSKNRRRRSRGHDVVRTGAHKFSFTSGSKGGLGVMLCVAGDQTMTFVNCHLEANQPARRHQQLDILTRKLPRAMGMENSKLDLAACSDHVVWMGDFNYRVHSLDGDTVLKLLGTHRHMELHDRYDSMKDDMETVPGMRPFKEAAKWPSFYPTYKNAPIELPRCPPRTRRGPCTCIAYDTRNLSTKEAK
ncbi:hypothetical protein FI667_g12933, partial [Globisporangium splendens]